MKYHTEKLEAYTQGVLSRAGASADLVLVPSCTGILTVEGQVTLLEEEGTPDRFTLELFVPRWHLWCINAAVDPYWWGLTVLVWHEVAHVLTLRSGQHPDVVHGKRWREAFCTIAAAETGMRVVPTGAYDHGPGDLDNHIVDQLRRAGARPPLWGVS